MAALAGSAIALLPASSSSKKIPSSKNDEKPEPQGSLESSVHSIPDIAPGPFRLYRQSELNRITASLLANGSILVAGEEGSGKSVLANSVVEKLRSDGFAIAHIEPATTKQMLIDIADQLGVETHNLEGKALTADHLKLKIADFLQENTAFIVVDDCHNCDGRFRFWLKQLRKQGVPMLIVFLSLPPMILAPLPEYAIREIMEQAALERGISLKNSDLARLQERTGGNPMLAQRAINEEYLGLEIEVADHGRYVDITPFILIAGIVFMVLRFIGRGTDDRTLYLISGIGGVVFMGFSRLLYNLPQESRRVQR